MFNFFSSILKLARLFVLVSRIIQFSQIGIFAFFFRFITILCDSKPSSIVRFNQIDFVFHINHGSQWLVKDDMFSFSFNNILALSGQKNEYKSRHKSLMLFKTHWHSYSFNKHSFLSPNFDVLVRRRNKNYCSGDIYGGRGIKLHFE